MSVEPFRNEARSLIAAGADPRRAGQAAAAFFGVPRTIGAREAHSRGMALGAAVVVALALLGYVLVLSEDVRIAALVRSVAPEVDGLSRTELAARLTGAPGRVDPETARSRPDFAAVLSEQLRADLEAFPEADRSLAVEDLVRLRPLLRDPVALRLDRTVGSLPPAVRAALVRDDVLGPLLVWAAPLTAEVKGTLTTLDLRPLLGDPDRRALLQALPDLDPAAAGALARWRTMGPGQRQALAAVLSILDSDAAGDRFPRLVAAYQAAAPSLVEVLKARLANCSFTNRRACR